MFKRIVVPLDGSKAAESVVPYVERVASATNADVTLLAAVDKPRDWGEDTGGDLKGERHEAESYLRTIQAGLASATGRDVDIQVVAAEPVSAILDASGRRPADLHRNDNAWALGVDSLGSRERGGRATSRYGPSFCFMVRPPAGRGKRRTLRT